MGKNIFITLAILLAILLSTGCSSLNSPSEPANYIDRANTEEMSRGRGSSHSCRGIWQFTVNPVSQSLESIPLRTADMPSQLTTGGSTQPDTSAALSISIKVRHKPLKPRTVFLTGF